MCLDPKDTNKRIENLKLYETCYLEDTLEVRRVQGGLIYTTTLSSEQAGRTSYFLIKSVATTFVPFKGFRDIVAKKRKSKNG